MHPLYRTGVRYSPEKTFYIFNQQIYFIIFFLTLAEQSQFIPLQNAVYFIMLPFLVRKIFTFYINDVMLFKCRVPGPKGQHNVHCCYITALQNGSMAE
jgi:hypothetical protein